LRTTQFGRSSLWRCGPNGPAPPLSDGRHPADCLSRWPTTTTGGVRGESPYNPGPILPAATGAGIAIYLALEGRLDAVGPDGSEVPGWPYMLPSSGEEIPCRENVLPMPDGGVVGGNRLP
jgi:hypothetical protein